METLKRAAKWCVISGAVGMAIGMSAMGLAEASARFKFQHNLETVGLFLLILAPGLIADLGMLPGRELLLDVLAVNFVLYGFLGLLAGVVRSLIGAGGPPPSDHQENR